MIKRKNWKILPYATLLIIHLAMLYIFLSNSFFRWHYSLEKCRPQISQILTPYRSIQYIRNNISPKLKAEGRKINIYCNYNIGGIVGYHLYPECKIFIHSLSLWYSKKHFEAFQRIWKNDQVDYEFISSFYKIDIFMVNLTDPLNYRKGRIEGLFTYLNRSWSLVYVNETTAIYIRKDLGRKLNLKRVDLEKISPENNKPLCDYGYFWLASFLLETGHFHQAKLFSQVALKKIKIIQPLVYLQLGKIFLKLGKTLKAINCFTKGLKDGYDNQLFVSLIYALRKVPKSDQNNPIYQKGYNLLLKWKKR